MIDFTEYIGFFDFSIFRPHSGRLKWSILLKVLDFFDFSTSCWEVKLIDFTWYIGFCSTFRLFDLLPGDQNDWSYRIYWFFRLFDFSTSWWEVKMINFTEYIDFFRLFDLLLGGQTNRFYWIFILNFSTFRPLTGRSKWLILLNILYFFDFSTFRSLGGSSNWLILLNILDFFWLFDLSSCCWEVKLIYINEYIGFYRLFDFSTCSWEIKIIDFT